MKLVLQRDACGNGRTCPNLNTTDHGSYVIQGYNTCEQPVSATQATVEVPLALLPELAATSNRDGVRYTDRDGVRYTDRDTVLISGTQVTDPEALTELNLPAGENAVEVPLSLLREESVVA